MGLDASSAAIRVRAAAGRGRSRRRPGLRTRPPRAVGRGGFGPLDAGRRAPLSPHRREEATSHLDRAVTAACRRTWRTFSRIGENGCTDLKPLGLHHRGSSGRLGPTGQAGGALRPGRRAGTRSDTPRGAVRRVWPTRCSEPAAQRGGRDCEPSGAAGRVSSRPAGQSRSSLAAGQRRRGVVLRRGMSPIALGQPHSADERNNECRAHKAPRLAGTAPRRACGPRRPPSQKLFYGHGPASAPLTAAAGILHVAVSVSCTRTLESFGAMELKPWNTRWRITGAKRPHLQQGGSTYYTHTVTAWMTSAALSLRSFAKKITQLSSELVQTMLLYL